MGNENKKSSLKGGEYMNATHLALLIDELNAPKPRIPSAIVTFCESERHTERFTQRVDDINKALKSADSETRFNLTVELFRLWINAERQEAQIIFGELHQEYGKKQLSFTFTVEEKQFRVWYGPYANIGSYNPKPGTIAFHVDSCGKNLLFSVNGDAEVVKQYKDTILEIYGLDKLQKVELKHEPSGLIAVYQWMSISNPPTQST